MALYDPVELQPAVQPRDPRLVSPEDRKAAARIGASPSHARNYRLLAEYLWSLPPEYRHFDMSHYYISGGGVVTPDPRDCGAVACAVGHAPAALGHKRNPLQEWAAYTREQFGGAISPHVVALTSTAGRMALYCFDASWRDVDNTPRGAAQRILYGLQNGPPENFTGEDHQLSRLRLQYQEVTL